MYSVLPLNSLLQVATRTMTIQQNNINNKKGRQQEERHKLCYQLYHNNTLGQMYIHTTYNTYSMYRYTTVLTRNHCLSVCLCVTSAPVIKTTDDTRNSDTSDTWLSLLTITLRLIAFLALFYWFSLGFITTIIPCSFEV